MKARQRHLAALLCASVVAGCQLAPPDTPTPVTIPAAFAEADGWSVAEPADFAPRGPWWRVFGSDELDGLEAQLNASNPSLEAAVARYDQARALARNAAANRSPTLTIGARESANQVSQATANPLARRRFDGNVLSADLSYEIDLWGRVRDMTRAGRQRAQASAADLAATALSLQAELAADYFVLRGYDAQITVLDETLAGYENALAMTRSRLAAGYAAEADVSAADAARQLAKTRAEDVRLQRAQLEHAIAVLVGVAPAGFSLPVGSFNGPPPPVASMLPSALLQRRPDIAAAQRRVFAANADMGAARAAFFPQFTLAGGLGSQSQSVERLLTAPATAWALGPAAVLTVFDGGRRRAAQAQAKGAQGEAAAEYRRTVLRAYGEVEDSLAGLGALSREAASLQAALKAATTARIQAERRYAGGYASYFEVVTAQNIELAASLQATDTATRRLTASVALIKSLGGGWTEG